MISTSALDNSCRRSTPFRPFKRLERSPKSGHSTVYYRLECPELMVWLSTASKTCQCSMATGKKTNGRHVDYRTKRRGVEPHRNGATVKCCCAPLRSVSSRGHPGSVPARPAGPSICPEQPLHCVRIKGRSWVKATLPSTKTEYDRLVAKQSRAAAR